LKEKLNSDGNKIHQYQQNKQLHLFQMIKKKTQHMLMEIQFLAWDWYKHVSGSTHSRHDITEILLKVALNSINHLCLLDNWICNHNTDINKQKNVCLGKEKEQRLVDLESV
jgi:hypothetical protein